MKKKIIEIETREKKPHDCDLCGKPVNVPDDMHIGGFISWAHPECAELAEKTVDLYLRWLTLSPQGLTTFTHHINEIISRDSDTKRITK